MLKHLSSTAPAGPIHYLYTDAAPFHDSYRSDQLTLASAIVEVDLPVQQWRFAQNWRLSPVAASYLHGRKTYIHVLRINECVLLGMPADYSAELERSLQMTHSEAGLPVFDNGLIPMVTSFNGDYIGYLVPRSRYEYNNLETRSENVFGPWCGEYFNDISLRLIERLAKTDIASSRPSSAPTSPASL